MNIKINEKEIIETFKKAMNMDNLILKSGFRVLRIDNYLDYRDVKTVRISCHELPDEEDNTESDAYYFLTKEEMQSIIKKLKESILYLENQPE